MRISAPLRADTGRRASLIAVIGGLVGQFKDFLPIERPRARVEMRPARPVRIDPSRFGATALGRPPTISRPRHGACSWEPNPGVRSRKSTP